MNILKCVLIMAVAFCARPLLAQSSPIKVKVTRVSGAQSVLETKTPREVKLRVNIQNLTSKPLEGLEVRWMFVVDTSYAPRQFEEGKKSVELKPLATAEFDSSVVEVSRNTTYGPQLRGHWLRISHEGKTLFEEYNPQTLKKIIEQHEKDKEKGIQNRKKNEEL